MLTFHYFDDIIKSIIILEEFMDNLIKRLGEKLKNLSYSVSHSKVVRMLAVGALTFSMALSFAACKPHNQDTPNPPIINPGTDDPSNPGKNPTNPGAEDPYAKYSPALQAVLNSDYYNKQITKAKNGQFHAVNGYSVANNVFGQIPYTFLEGEGYDVDELKTTDVEITALTYTYEGKENELYNLVNVSYNTKDRYISQYLLKYKISDQEYKDLKMLINGNYIQTGLFVQELNNFHTPEVVSHYNIGYDAYNTILSALGRANPIKAKIEKGLETFSISNIYPENNYSIDLQIFGKTDSSTDISKILTTKIDFRSLSNAHFENNVFEIGTFAGEYSNVSDTSNISMYKDYPGLGGKDLAI